MSFMDSHHKISKLAFMDAPVRMSFMDSPCAYKSFMDGPLPFLEHYRSRDHILILYLKILLQAKFSNIKWSRCPSYAPGDPTQLNDGLQAFGLLWKGMEDSTALCPRDNFSWSVERFCHPMAQGWLFANLQCLFQPEIVNPVKKYQLSEKSRT